VADKKLPAGMSCRCCRTDSLRRQTRLRDPRR